MLYNHVDISLTNSSASNASHSRTLHYIASSYVIGHKLRQVISPERLPIAHTYDGQWANQPVWVEAISKPIVGFTVGLHLPPITQFHTMEWALLSQNRCKSRLNQRDKQKIKESERHFWRARPSDNERHWQFLAFYQCFLVMAMLCTGNSLEAGFNWNESDGWILSASTPVWRCKHSSIYCIILHYVNCKLSKCQNHI